MQHHAAITMRFAASTRKLAPIYAQSNTRTPNDTSHAAIPMRSATGDSETPYNYAHTSTPKAASSHHYTAARKKRQTDRSRTRCTDEVPFITGCSHFTRKKTRFRAPASSPKQSPCNIMQPFQCDLQAQIPKHPITTYTQAHPKQLEATVTMRQKKRQTDRSRTCRTDEVPFIAGCSHFTRKKTRFRAPASSPTHHLPSSPLPFLTTSHRHHLASSPLPFLTTSHRHHIPSSTSLPHHFPSSPLPFLTTSHRPHLPSSPLAFIITSLRHHFPSSPLPIVTTSLPHHFPSSPLPFLTTSHRHHFPSSPLPFVTTSHRHHFPSSPLPFVTTPSLSAPFIKVNSTASYSCVVYCYVMYCYTIYRPSSFQVSEFYLSVTRKYCFPTSFDKFISFVLEHPHNIECVGTKDKVAAPVERLRSCSVLKGCCQVKKCWERRTFTTTRACNQ